MVLTKSRNTSNSSTDVRLRAKTACPPMSAFGQSRPILHPPPFTFFRRRVLFQVVAMW